MYSWFFCEAVGERVHIIMHDDVLFIVVFLGEERVQNRSRVDFCHRPPWLGVKRRCKVTNAAVKERTEYPISHVELLIGITLC